jgi:ABC-type transport system involved in cytochrome bd biosynthesis fused ATPase/permease subunit
MEPRGSLGLRITRLRARWPGGEVVASGDADLLLPAGHRAALVGCGRLGVSALAAVLLRLIDYDGSVTLGGVELRELSGDDVRRVIGRCSRDTRIEPTTVAANVRSARPGAAEGEVADAMRRAGLGDPPGAAIGESAPEALRRRVALARVLLAGLPIVVIDEPADDAVLADILSAAEDRTLLLVSRREAVPGAAPVLRHVDEVVSLSAR